MNVRGAVGRWVILPCLRNLLTVFYEPNMGVLIKAMAIITAKQTITTTHTMRCCLDNGMGKLRWESAVGSSANNGRVLHHGR